MDADVAMMDMMDLCDAMDWSRAPKPDCGGGTSPSGGTAKSFRSSQQCPTAAGTGNNFSANHVCRTEHQRARLDETCAAAANILHTRCSEASTRAVKHWINRNDPFAKVNPFLPAPPDDESASVSPASTVYSFPSTSSAASLCAAPASRAKSAALLVRSDNCVAGAEFELDPAFANASVPRAAETISASPGAAEQSLSQQLPRRTILTPASRRPSRSAALHIQGKGIAQHLPLRQRPQAYATFSKRLVQYGDIDSGPSADLCCPPTQILALQPARTRKGGDYYTGPGPTHEIGDLLGGLAVDTATVARIDSCTMDVEQRRDRGPRQYHQRNGGRGGGYDNRRRQFSGNYRRDGGDRFQGGGGGGYQNRKRRHDDGDERDERRPMKQRYEEPIASRLRREILVVGEAVGPGEMAGVAAQIGKRIADNFEDDQVSGLFLDQVMQLIAEQPLKIPILAAVFLYANESNQDVTKQILERAAERTQDALDEGRYRELKLMLRFFACLQSVYSGAGIFSLLDDLFNKAADQQTASQDDVIGFELVKIILLTLPYVMASNATGLEDKAKETLEKTEIIAMAQHPLENVADPYPINEDERPFPYQSALRLLQEQSQREADGGWALSCLPRIYTPTRSEKEENGNETMNGDSSGNHGFPSLTIPAQAHPGTRPIFPETFFSIYADQQVESTPGSNVIASSLIRDTVVDTINILDINRHSVAKFLIELDNYFAPGTFTKRATSFDKLKDIPEGDSTWKTEDMAIDCVFSQIFSLPQAEHKLVYYHGVITETCKLAPGAIAPTLGRAIRFLYRNIDSMDLELSNRFLDWFSHHLSNFDFRWKWTEWTEYVDGSAVLPKHAFILAAIDKEIRLSFTKRIRDTLPPEYHKLIAEGKLKDTPDFKYKSADAPYSSEGQQILGLLRKKAPEIDIEPVIEAIQSQAAAQGVEDVLVPSTDAYMTAVCHIGAKSLSHVLSCIDRCKERLLGIGAVSEGARRQIIQSVVDYWKDLPGVAVNIVDKLLNFTIVTPESVVRWCLGAGSLQAGVGLADAWRFEMLAATMGKITNRMRQIVAARVHAHKVAIADEQIAMLDDTIAKERDGMRTLFGLIADLLNPYVDGSAVADGMHDAHDAQLVQAWSQRWTLAFRRKLAVEETVVGEAAVQATLVVAKRDAAREEARKAKEEAEREARRIEHEERRRREEEERVKKEKEEEEQARPRAAENEAATAGDGDGGAEALDVADDDV